MSKQGGEMKNGPWRRDNTGGHRGPATVSTAFQERGIKRGPSGTPVSPTTKMVRRYFATRGWFCSFPRALESPVRLLGQLPCTHQPLSQPFVISGAPCGGTSRGSPPPDCNCAAF